MTMNPHLVAPIAKGDVIGKVEVKLDDKVVHSADLIALTPSTKVASSAACGIASACSSTACSTDKAPAKPRVDPTGALLSPRLTLTRPLRHDRYRSKGAKDRFPKLTIPSR
jgi:hypothetical protein